MARPSDYTDEIATEICRRLALGESLVKICEEDGFPVQSTVYLWLQRHKEFSEKYTRARDQQADVLAEQTVTIADETNDPAKARLQIDARKWFASKVAPKKYGDKIAQELSGPNGQPIATSLEISFVEAAQVANPISEET